jgi:hypothetical protein
MPPRRAAVTLAATPAEVRAAVLTAMTPHAAALALRLMPDEARTEALAWLDWSTRAAVVSSAEAAAAEPRPRLGPSRAAGARQTPVPPPPPPTVADAAAPPAHRVAASAAAVAGALPLLVWAMLQEAAAVDVRASPLSPRALLKGVLRAVLASLVRLVAVGSVLFVGLLRGEAERARDDDAARARRAELLAANQARWLPFLVLKLVDLWMQLSRNMPLL